MKSYTERQLINGYKWTKERRDEADRRVEYLRAKYKTAISFFYVTWKLKLFDRAGQFNNSMNLYGPRYLGAKLTQRLTYGTFDANRPERGTRGRDQHDKTHVPSWFSAPYPLDRR